MIIEKAPPSMGTVGCDGEPYTWRRQPEKWRPIDKVNIPLRAADKITV